MERRNFFPPALLQRRSAVSGSPGGNNHGKTALFPSLSGFYSEIVVVFHKICILRTWMKLLCFVTRVAQFLVHSLNLYIDLLRMINLFIFYCVFVLVRSRTAALIVYYDY